MTFAIITHVPHISEHNNYFAYAPYVSEMNVWAKYVEELIVVAPIIKTEKTAVDTAYQHQNITFIPIEDFDVLSLKSILRKKPGLRVKAKTWGKPNSLASASNNSTIWRPNPCPW